MGTQYLIGFLGAHARRGALEEVLGRAGETRPVQELADDGTWSSYAQFRRLFEAAGLVLGGQRRLADVGLGAWEFGPKSNPEWLEMLKATLGSPGGLFANGIAYSSMWPLLRVVGEEVGPTEWVMRHTMKDGFAPFKEFCWFFSGMHAVTPKMFGFPTGDVVEEACQCDGAPACLFRIRWEAVGDGQSQAEASRRQVQMLEGRLEALQRTVAEIVSGEDLGEVLARITASAACAVPAPAYVLALHAASSSSQQVYSVGLDDDDSVRIAAELLADDHSGDDRRLSVEIVSKRRSYGHLAAISRQDHHFMPQELGILEAYGRLAAAALDSATALDEARALLTLSTSLAAIVSEAEVATKVAHAVPAVIDCDGAVVVLLDAAGTTARVTASAGYPDDIAIHLRSLDVASQATVADIRPSERPVAGTAHGKCLVDALLADTACLGRITVPIVVNGEAIGWLAASVTKLPDRLLAVEVTEGLRGLADQAANAISNARLLDQIRHQALHDTLTGLPNRALILDRADQMLTRARRQKIPAAAMFIDLDGFKDVNDTLGHAAGDHLLQAVAARLGSALRGADTIGRLGGDEFVVLVEGASLDAGPELVAERLLDVLREPFILVPAGPPLGITASIGISVGDRSSADDLLRDADVALYRAKATGKDRYALFAPEMQTALHDRVELETDLRGALVAGEFFLLYQPIFDLRTSTMTGVEALLRWQHPTRGVVQPDDFIPVLEETGAIVDIGRWVLHQACAQAATWHAQGYRLNISINVSARQLEDDRLVSDIADTLTLTRLDPSTVIVEITETTIMRDADATTKRLTAIRALGVRIAVDDFGTGYSSLAYLRRFPVDTIKIDRSFITAIAESPDARALIHTLIQLGKTLGMETLAEGIEKTYQSSVLQQEQCDSGQGFLYSRPLAPDGVAQLLALGSDTDGDGGPRLTSTPARGESGPQWIADRGMVTRHGHGARSE